MTSRIFSRYVMGLALGLAALAKAASPSFAVELAAVPAQWTPPGGGTPIVMWGYVEVTNAAAYDCTTVVPTDPWAVGPTLNATAEGTLTINIKNCLTEPVSVFIPGQAKATTPVWTDGSTGPRGADLTKRVRSFDTETVAGAVGTYAWTGVKEGTYLYHSGTHPQVQVQMGLYGTLVVTGGGYPTVAAEHVLLYSEIDPALHAAVAGGTYGTPAYPSTFDYVPKYFLINGKSYPDTTDIAVGLNQNELLRFVNAGLKTHVPTLGGGLYMTLIAEDGNLYPFTREQYSTELPAAKTIDATINVGTGGRYALYDRALYLTNAAATGGGMLTYINVAPAGGAPTAVNDGPYPVAEDTVGGLVVPAPGVLGNDNPLTGLTAILVTSTANGTLALNAADGSFTYTPNADFNGPDLFTYMANNGTLNSNVATVTITVTPVDDPPVANDDSASTLPEVAVIINVLANDTDPDGNLNPASVTVTSGPTNGTTAVNIVTGAITYTPNVGFTGPTDTFVYEVCDTTAPTPLCDTATVTITVVNNPPVANDDAATTPAQAPVTINVVANDTDPDGNLAPATANNSCATCTAPASGTLVNNANGTFTYTSTGTYIGSDSFVYEVCDTLGLCDTATVNITVTNNAPVANNDFASTPRNSAGVVISVTLNDVDTDGTINVATVDLNPLVAGIQTSVTASRGGTATVTPLGVVTFVPKKGFRGTDTFTYTVQDNVGATSNVATVRVNVL